MLQGRKTISGLGLGSQQRHFHQIPARPGTDLVLVTKHSKIAAADLISHLISSDSGRWHAEKYLQLLMLLWL